MKLINENKHKDKSDKYDEIIKDQTYNNNDLTTKITENDKKLKEYKQL